MFRGGETCLCCITLFCQSNASTVTESSPSVKGIARLENMVHNLIKKAGIKPSIKAMPVKAVKNPSIYKKLLPTWFSFKDWDTMDADVFFNSNLKSLVTLKLKEIFIGQGDLLRKCAFLIFVFYQDKFGSGETLNKNLSKEMDFLSKDFLSNVTSQFFSRTENCGSLDGKVADIFALPIRLR